MVYQYENVQSLWSRQQVISSNIHNCFVEKEIIACKSITLQCTKFQQLTTLSFACPNLFYTINIL